MMAGLPSLVADRRRPAATALFSALDDLGYTVGPAAAAGLLLLAGPATVVLLNGASFAISAVVLARAPFGPVPAVEPGNSEDGGSLVAQAREGLRAASARPGVRTVILGSSGVVLFAGLFNVAELLLTGDELHAGPAGYAVLVAAFGLGVAGGSLRGARGGSAAELGRGYLAGLLLTGAGFVACGLAPSFAAAAVTFALAGAGNGLVLVHERLLLQALVPDRLGGRVFGVKDALQSWAFLPGLAGAAALIPVIGTRTLLVLAGAGVLLVWAATWRALTPAAAPRRAVALVAATAQR